MPSFCKFFRETYDPIRLLGRSEATKTDFYCCLLRWQRITGLPIEQVTLPDLAQYLGLLAESRSPATVNKHRRYLLAILRFARKQNLTGAVWLDDVPRLPEYRDEPEAWLLDEIELLIAVSRRLEYSVGELKASHFFPALILLIFATGSRISATMAIHREDVDLAGRSVVIRAKRQKNRRGQRHRLIDPAVSAIAGIWEPERKHLFAWPWDHWGRQWPALNRRFRKLIDTAGLKQPKDPFHKLRRSCASYTAAGGGEALAQSTMGHSNPATTQGYLDPRIVQTKQAADVLPRPKI